MKLIFLLFLSFSSLFSLSQQQIDIIISSYNIGKNIKAINNETFGLTTAAIALTETSAGKDSLIGDKHISDKLNKQSLGIFQIRVPTAKFLINKNTLIKKHYNHLIKNEKLLINLLLTNKEFSAFLAGNYIKLNYDKALKRNYKNPYFYAVSKYNGGTRNFKYYNKVIKNIKIVKKILKDNNVKF